MMPDVASLLTVDEESERAGEEGEEAREESEGEGDNMAYEEDGRFRVVVADTQVADTVVEALESDDDDEAEVETENDDEDTEVDWGR